MRRQITTALLGATALVLVGCGNGTEGPKRFNAVSGSIVDPPSTSTSSTSTTTAPDPEATQRLAWAGTADTIIGDFKAAFAKYADASGSAQACRQLAAATTTALAGLPAAPPSVAGAERTLRASLATYASGARMCQKGDVLSQVAATALLTTATRLFGEVPTALTGTGLAVAGYLTGTANQSSKPFTLTAPTQRLSGACISADPGGGGCLLQIIKAGETANRCQLALSDQGDLPSDEKDCNLDPGDYFLKVQVFGDWTYSAAVEEEAAA